MRGLKQMNIEFNLFPGLKSRALTMSYDDGQAFDIRLSQILTIMALKAHFI